MTSTQSRKPKRTRKQKRKKVEIALTRLGPGLVRGEIVDSQNDEADPSKESATGEGGLSSKVVAKIRKLDQMAEELRQGENFSITRMTMIKSLCDSPEAANRFAVHLAKLTQQRMQSKSCPKHLSPENWSQYLNLATEAIPQMGLYLEEPTSENTNLLRQQLSEIADAQNEYTKGGWDSVRIIYSRELLLVEHALRCLVSHNEFTFWAYQVAKEYVERYDSRYGSGLIPKSWSFVKDIADFWCRYHVGVPLSEWFVIPLDERKE